MVGVDDLGGDEVVERPAAVLSDDGIDLGSIGLGQDVVSNDRQR